MDTVARNQIHEFLERDHEKYTSESIARGTGIPIAKVRAILAIESKWARIMTMQIHAKSFYYINKVIDLKTRPFRPRVISAAEKVAIERCKELYSEDRKHYSLVSNVPNWINLD